MTLIKFVSRSNFDLYELYRQGRRVFVGTQKELEESNHWVEVGFCKIISTLPEGNTVAIWVEEVK